MNEELMVGQKRVFNSNAPVEYRGIQFTITGYEEARKDLRLELEVKIVLKNGPEEPSVELYFIYLDKETVLRNSYLVEMRSMFDGTVLRKGPTLTANPNPLKSSNVGFDFSTALLFLKQEKKVARSGWNGKNQFVVMMPALFLPPFNTQDTNRKVNDRTAKHIGEDTPLDSQPYLALFNAQGKWQPGWVPSQGDLFAEDWIVL